MMATRRETADTDVLCQHLAELKLPFMHEHHQQLAHTAADKHWSHLDFLGELVSGEAAQREDPRSRLAERVRAAVEQHAFVLPSGETLRRTCSIGYAMFPFAEHMPALLTWEQVIAVADLGMYSAKTLGRNRCISVLAEADFSTLEDVDELLVKGLGEAVGHHRVVLAT